MLTQKHHNIKRKPIKIGRGVAQKWSTYNLHVNTHCKPLVRYSKIKPSTLTASLPLTRTRTGTRPPKVSEFKRGIRGADAILFVTPEYNNSVPGVLKNAIDWASRPYGDSAWNGKPAAIMGASPGAMDTARAQYHLRQILVFLNMFPINVPEVMISHAASCFDKEGNLTDESTRDHIRRLLQSLLEWARRLTPS
ncbi:MAG: putative flavoprotein [Pedosphaera sp.]|nr:putative flavoprotein [Pedosphaera sp.]